MNAIAKKKQDSMLSRMVGWLWKRKERTDPIDLGASYQSPPTITPTYDLRTAMSAYAGLPWVFAAMTRKSGDLAGVPLVVRRGRGRHAERIDDHPFYDLIDRPHPSSTGRQLRRQLAIDKWLTGNSYGIRIGARALATLQRAHPNLVRIEPDPYLGINRYAYEVDGGEQFLDSTQVYHTRNPSWEDDARGLYGSGAILALHEELTAAQRALKRSSEIAAKGRPDAILSPGDDLGSDWGDETRRKIKEMATKMLQDGGVLVLNRKVKFDIPNFNPRDMEFEKLISLTRESVLAVTGVPPHLVGLPSANYALADAQERCYWEGLVAEAADFEDSLWTPLIRQLYGREYSVIHDFSEITVLQEARSKRLERAKQRVDLGGRRDSAYVAEGLSAGIEQESTDVEATDERIDNLLDFARWFERDTSFEDEKTVIKEFK